MMNQTGRKQLTGNNIDNSPEIALANEVFDQFCNASTLKSILGYYRQLCELLKIRPNVVNHFYPKLKLKLRSWKAQALWKKFDQRANHKCYNRGKACPNTKILIIGGGPCGLRTAIEAQLLGAKVVLVEKRDRMSRNNVLHLWPFVIQDLRSLGAKKFFGKFCAGSIDHISIRQLQCILLKVALILGVEFHENVSFDYLVPPPDNQGDGKIGWRAKTSPADPVSQYEFDVLIGADGKRNTLEGFKRKEFRGKLAIAITANFINKRTEAEARVEEISGVAFIFNQRFFKELYQETGIDLENIVYYKDDTHYFVMTAKKHSLIDKGVIVQDHADTARLLAKENVNREALMLYAREAAEFSTKYQMMDMEFAVNHYGQPDVAMFDFTSMYAAENASRVLERYGHRLLMILVGDSLLEPFWPTGSGCARGFLSSLDAGWAIKSWGALFSPLEVIAERESIYRLLGQTTPENLNRDYAAYTLDPHTRYPNLNVHSVTPMQVHNLLDTDDPESIKQSMIQYEINVPKKRRRHDTRTDTQVHPDTLLCWLQKQVALYDTVHIEDMGASFKDGLAICAIIHKYRPDLINFHSLKAENVVENNQLAFDVLEKELNIPPIMTGEEMAQCDVPDKLAMFSYLTQIYEALRGVSPHVKHPKLETELQDHATHPKQLKQLTPDEKSTRRHSRLRHSGENAKLYADKDNTVSRRCRKRRSTEKASATDEWQRKNEKFEKYRAEYMKRRQYLSKLVTRQFYKSMQMLQANAKTKKDEPFEDYSIFLYRQSAPNFQDRIKDLEQKILYPDREPKVHISYQKGNTEEEFSERVKLLEDKLKGTACTEKKPKDLLRAIGKIEKTDWNVKEIEKKIEENRMGRGVRHDYLERVPKWSREQFLARQIKMEKRSNGQTDIYSKYADIDNTLKSIDKKIREGSALGYNKVSVMAEQFSPKNQDAEFKVQKSNVKPTIMLPAQGGSEICHFCKKRVYLMERLSAEGKYFHRSCFRCEYCSILLRIGNHTFDREKNGGRFYCSHHFGLTETIRPEVDRKRISLVNKENVSAKPPEEGQRSVEHIGFDLIDRSQTQERIEFENLAEMSDPEEAHSQMDEDEWTDRNFGASAAEMGSSDHISDMSSSDEDNEEYEKAIDQPLTQTTTELAKNWTQRYFHPHATIGQSDTGSNEYEDSSDDYTSEEDESNSGTEDEEDVRARELRKQEVWLKMPLRCSDSDTGSETEVASSDDESTEENRKSSATEISTDSEFEHDEVTPTQHEVPEITINDLYVRKTRGTYVEPKKVQVKSKLISLDKNNLSQKKSEVDSKQLSEDVRTKHEPNKEENSGLCRANTNTPLVNPRKGDYLLNRTHSTGGLASRLSLELKKRYLLDGSALGGSIVKSDSASNVDTKLRNFTDAISQHQKLLNPAPEPSPNMVAFLQGTGKLRTNNTPLSPISPTTFFSQQLPDDCRNSSRDAKPTTLREMFKSQQLPDLVKESSIMKSKTAPNICDKSSLNDREEMEQRLILHQAANAPINAARATKNTQNAENNLLSNAKESNRSYSPFHETSIVVPQVDWEKKEKDEEEEEDKNVSLSDSDIDTDSLSSSDFKEAAENDRHVAVNHPLPRLQIHSTDGDLVLDEGCDRYKCYDPDNGQTFEPDSIEVSFLRDRRLARQFDTSNDPSLGNARVVEAINNNMEQLRLQDNSNNRNSPTPEHSISDGERDDSEENDVTTAAFTETEFSDWARDEEGLVSTDLCDDGIDTSNITIRRNKAKVSSAKTAKVENTDLNYFKINRILDQKYPNNSISKLLVNNEDINYMDTDNESLLEDSLQDASNFTLLKTRSYTEFVNDKPPLSNIPSLTNISHGAAITDAPIARLENDSYGEEEEKEDEEGGFKDVNVIKINPVTMEDVLSKRKSIDKTETKEQSREERESDAEPGQLVEALNMKLVQSLEEDSLLVTEPEDTTISEVTVLASPVSPPGSTVSAGATEKRDGPPDADSCCNEAEYLEYKRGLESRIAHFSNVKDSIDVRKSRPKGSKSAAQARVADVSANESANDNSANSPATSRKLEEITKERSKQRNVIEDLLMDKLEAYKQKSAEKKARRAARNSSFNATQSPLKLPSNVATNDSVFVPTSVVLPVSSPERSVSDETSESRRVSLSRHEQCDQVEAKENISSRIGQLSRVQMTGETLIVTSAEDVSRRELAPLKLKNEDARRISEKVKRGDAREKARIKSDENLAVSTEDKLKELRLMAIRRRLSMQDASETERVKSFAGMDNPELKLQTSKSIDNMKSIAKKPNREMLLAVNAKSMDELSNAASFSVLSNDNVARNKDRKKSKDLDRRRSIIQAVSDFFFKKESSSSSSSP